MDKETNHGRNQDDMKKPDSRRNYYIERDIIEWNERTESAQEAGKER